MQQILKQSAGSDTASEHKVFFRARLRLTAIYGLILAVIVVGYSIFLYQNLHTSLLESSEDDFANHASQQHFIQATLAATGEEIFITDIIILFLAAGASYVLAGYTLRPIQRSVEAQKMFAENASHELRTPLAVMQNDVEVLLRSEHPTKEAVHSTLNSVLEEIGGMSKMTENLLLLARLGNRKKAEGSTDLAGIILGLAEKLKPIASAKKLSLKTELSDGRLGAKVEAKDMERVLSNLIQNSLEYAPSGGTVSIQASRQENAVFISVSDTGPGITEKDMPHIFERFYKGQSSSGTGLGLSIAKEIIENYGGSISLESAVGKGTKAIIRLPAV